MQTIHALACVLAALLPPSFADDLPEDRGAQFFVMNAHGTDVRRLGGIPGYSELGMPSYSPDGTHIVVDASGPEGNVTTSRVLVLDAMAKHPVDVGLGALPCWSPDGTKLAYTRLEPEQGFEVGWFDLNAGAFRSLSGGRGIAWSPVGDYVVFLKDGVVVHELATGIETRPLEGHSKYADSLHWKPAISPDGRRICGKVISDSAMKKHAVLLIDLFPIAAIEPPARELPVQTIVRDREVLPYFAWHPTEPRVVFPMRSAEHFNTFLLYEFNPTQPDSVKLVAGQPLDRWNQAAAWHPNGKQLLFISKPNPN
ncbi:MAG: hypothetical protein SH850_04215 [Planctomycetaceae bacterium]|nr:hypothetical protein [Planctomycetaceae bacterium]